MLSTKFLVKWPFCSGEEEKNRFSRWPPWQPSWISDWNDFSSFFYLQVTPMLPTKFQVKWLFGSGEEVKNRFARWQPWWPSWISDWNDFSLFWSTSHPDASYQVSSQLAQGCRRSRLWSNCWHHTMHDGWRTTDDVWRKVDIDWLTTIAHLEHIVLRWANKMGFFFQINSKDQDLSCKMDLDL